ncbi:MAG: hypothetical protein QXH43_05800 [Metallosphaera sp.]
MSYSSLRHDHLSTKLIETESQFVSTQNPDASGQKTLQLLS